MPRRRFKFIFRRHSYWHMPITGHRGLNVVTIAHIIMNIFISHNISQVRWGAQFDLYWRINQHRVVSAQSKNCRDFNLPHDISGGILAAVAMRICHRVHCGGGGGMQWAWGSTSIAWCQHNERTVETSTYAMTSLGASLPQLQWGSVRACSEPHRSGGGGMHQTGELTYIYDMQVRMSRLPNLLHVTPLHSNPSVDSTDGVQCRGVTCNARVHKWDLNTFRYAANIWA